MSAASALLCALASAASSMDGLWVRLKSSALWRGEECFLTHLLINSTFHDWNLLWTFSLASAINYFRWKWEVLSGYQWGRPLALFIRQLFSCIMTFSVPSVHCWLIQVVSWLWLGVSPVHSVFFLHNKDIISVGQTVGRRSKNRSKWVEQRPYMVMLVGPQ